MARTYKQIGRQYTSGRHEGEWYDDFVSSNVYAFRYFSETEVLQVRFWFNVPRGEGGGREPGDVYTYYGVDPDVVESFARAGSKGQFVWHYLRGVYAYVNAAFEQNERLPGSPNEPEPDLQRTQQDVEFDERLAAGEYDSRPDVKSHRLDKRLEKIWAELENNAP